MDKYFTQLECTFVRDTMLRQEQEYQNQLRELHRLYNVQRALLHESRSRSSCGQEFLRSSINGATTGFQFFPPREEQAPPEVKNGFHLFPVQKEPKKRRCFDLEKLPDEQPEELEPEPEVKPTKEADLLNSFRTRNGIVQGEQQQTLHKPHWLLQAHANVEWNSRQFPQQQQQQPRTNSWLQLSHGCETKQFGLREPYYSESQLHNPWTTPSWPPVILSRDHATLANSSWYDRQTQCLQQNLQHQQQQQQQLLHFQQQQQQFQKAFPWQTPASSSSGYFPAIFSASSAQVFNGIQDTTQQLHWLSGSYAFGSGSGGGGGKLPFKKPAGVKLQDDLQQEFQRYMNAEAEKKLVPEREVVNHGNHGIADRQDASDEDAASILMSLGSDTTMVSSREEEGSREGSPGVLKNSVAWFANAMPETKPGPDGQSVEVDEFEAGTLRLTRLDEGGQIIADMETVREAAEAAAREEKPANTNGSSRPCRRRGKKKVDFQSETLPSIASLSRQEITEDLQIIGGLLRSASDFQAPPAAAAASEAVAVCNNKRGGKCGAKSSPVSTLEDVARSPRRRSNGNSNKKLVVGTDLPWLVSWGDSTRRKRKQRLRANHPKVLHVDGRTKHL